MQHRRAVNAVQRNASRLARRAGEPASLSTGSLTAAEGCVQWYNVKTGDSCYSAIATVEGGLSLEDFYAMNPQVDNDCFNLWKGYDYCVSRTTSSSKTDTPAPPKKQNVKVAQNNVAKTPKTTEKAEVKPAPTTEAVAAPTVEPTTAAPAPSPSPSPEPAVEEEDDDEECDAEDDDEEDDVATVTAAPVKAVAQQTTAPAPTTADDSARQAAAAAAAASAASKSSADAAWASSSKAAADAAWASSSSSSAAAAASSKAAADAAWQRQQAVKASPTTSTAAAEPETTKVFNGGDVNSKLSAIGISTFLGEQTGAIASWFRTNSGQDSTNGNSWCYRPYDDSMPGFAPSLKTMLASFGGDPIAAGKAFCGQEAEFTTPDGRTATLFIADAFDDRWVLTPTSVDVIHGAFHLLFGSTTDNKNDVVQGVTWRLTGNRRSDFVFNQGNPV